MLDRTMFVEALRFVSHASGVKDVRYYLNGVLFEIRPSRLTLVATDGHRMAVAEIDGEFGGVHEDVICKAADVKTFLTLCKPGVGEINLQALPGVLMIQATLCPDLTFTGIEGKFPDWRRGMPQGPTVPTEVICLNPQFVAEACKASAKLGGGKLTAVRIELRSATSCSWIEAPRRDALAQKGLVRAGTVIMPVRT